MRNQRHVPSSELSFTALSVGIGIGDLRSPTLDSQRLARRSPGNDADLVNKAPQPQRTAMAPMQVSEPQGKASAPAKRQGRGFSFRILAYGLDFFFVALTLAVALALATVLSAVRTGETDNWLATKPIQWLAGLDPYVIVGGVYAAFFAYALVFKLLAGKTFGEGLLGVSRKNLVNSVKA